MKKNSLKVGLKLNICTSLGNHSTFSSDLLLEQRAHPSAQTATNMEGHHIKTHAHLLLQSILEATSRDQERKHVGENL